MATVGSAQGEPPGVFWGRRDKGAIAVGAAEQGRVRPPVVSAEPNGDQHCDQHDEREDFDPGATCSALPLLGGQLRQRVGDRPLAHGSTRFRSEPFRPSMDGRRERTHPSENAAAPSRSAPSNTGHSCRCAARLPNAPPVIDPVSCGERWSCGRDRDLDHVCGPAGGDWIRGAAKRGPVGRGQDCPRGSFGPSRSRPAPQDGESDRSERRGLWLGRCCLRSWLACDWGCCGSDLRRPGRAHVGTCRRGIRGKVSLGVSQVATPSHAAVRAEPGSSSQS